MNRHTIPTRPAGAAIAAVLAFGTTPLMAETIDAPAQPPVSVAPIMPVPAPTVAPPVAAAPAQPLAGQAPVIQMKPAAPVVQPVPQAPPMAVIEEAAPEPANTPPVRAERRTEREAAPARQASPAPVERTAEPAASAPVTAAPSPSVPAFDETAPLAQDVAAPAPVANDSAVTPADNSMEYGLIAAGAIAVLGLGGVMLLRRRRRHGDYETPVYETATISAAPDGITPQPTFARDIEDGPTNSAFPQFATQTQTVRAEDDNHGSLEAMAAAAPSRANPFLTRKNRLRRANFLLNQQADAAPVNNGAVTAEESARDIAAPMQNDRTQTVHNFGTQPTIRFRFKPSTI